MLLPALTSLDLSHNNLYAVSPHILQSSPLLRIINLSHNSISAIRGDTANSYGSMLYFSLVPDGTFPQLGEVEVLDLSYNQIIKLEEESLAGLRLNLLDFSANLMRRLPSQALRNRVEHSIGPESPRATYYYMTMCLCESRTCTVSHSTPRKLGGVSRLRLDDNQFVSVESGDLSGISGNLSLLSQKHPGSH